MPVFVDEFAIVLADEVRVPHRSTYLEGIPQLPHDPVCPGRS